MDRIFEEIANIEDKTKEDLIVYYSEILKSRQTGKNEQQLNTTDTEIIMELLQSRTTKKENVYLLIQTGGGHFSEAVNIVDELRKEYTQVNFVIMTYAGSSGAYMCLCGDKVYMRPNAFLSDFGPLNWFIGKIETPEDMQKQAKILTDLYQEMIRQLAKGTLKTHGHDASKIIAKLGGPVLTASDNNRIHGSPLTIQNLKTIIPEIEYHWTIPAPGSDMNYIADNFVKLSKLVRKEMREKDAAKIIITGGHYSVVPFNRP